MSGGFLHIASSATKIMTQSEPDVVLLEKLTAWRLSPGLIIQMAVGWRRPTIGRWPSRLTLR